MAGPVPFVDDNAGGDGGKADPGVLEEYESIVSSLPSNPRMQLLCYQGAWLLQSWVPGIIAIQRGFVPRRGDVVLASLPKCGTTWLKALAFATMARHAHPTAGDEHHPLLRLNPHDCVPSMEKLFTAGWGRKIDALPWPRLMATHMHHSLLPASITDNPDCKIIYICRDPKDMIVSMWHFIRRKLPEIQFLDLFESACEGRCLSSPIWDHILGYWNASKTSPETVLFLRYEELLHDPTDSVRTLARFVGQPFSLEEEEAGVVIDIVKLCSFEKMKNLDVNKAAGLSPVLQQNAFTNESFFRRGGTGDWANHMTPEMAGRLDTIIEEKLPSIVSSLPSNPKLELLCYQGVWLNQSWVPGRIISIYPADIRAAPWRQKLFAAGLGSRMDALLSPRLMAMHMHYSLLPISITNNPDCKIIYICSKTNPETVLFLRYEKLLQNPIDNVKKLARFIG
uniref:Sulfotransferase n=1 Tax=Oryza punctata TaxID=4537 RepID=A0A0E0LH57_ORYPU